MANYPPEFASEWHYERHLEDLARELKGRENRLAELRALDTPKKVLDQTKAELEAVRAELARYGIGEKKATKRPAARGETR